MIQTTRRSGPAACLASIATVLVLGSLRAGEVLTIADIPLAPGGGGSPGGNSMILSNGSTFGGGATGVQGARSTGLNGATPLAANTAFQFLPGSLIADLDATYGAEAWTLAGPRLTFQFTLYANSSRFGGGAGTFDVFWVANDAWTPGASGAIYADSSDALAAWSGGQALLASAAYDWRTPACVGTGADATLPVWATDKSGARQATWTIDLTTAPGFAADLRASAGTAGAAVSLYLMATSDALGLTIFTGGGTSLPTLAFDVVAVPEPATLGLTAAGLFAALFATRRRYS